MKSSDAGKAIVRPWSVTFLALVGWVGISLPIAYMLWYPHEYELLLWMRGFIVKVAWFVTGLTLVTLDAFRLKTASERGCWVITIPFWAVVVLIAFVDWGFGMRWLDTFTYRMPGLALAPLIQIAFDTTVFLLTPIYVVYLSFLAIRAWLLRFIRLIFDRFFPNRA